MWRGGEEVCLLVCRRCLDHDVGVYERTTVAIHQRPLVSTLEHAMIVTEEDVQQKPMIRLFQRLAFHQLLVSHFRQVGSEAKGGRQGQGQRRMPGSKLGEHRCPSKRHILHAFTTAAAALLLLETLVARLHVMHSCVSAVGRLTLCRSNLHRVV